MKPIKFHGTSRKDLVAFPEKARHEAGYQLMQVQAGGDPDDWRPMKNIGLGVKEIRIHIGGQFRVVFVAKFKDAVHVLHAFQKKAQKTTTRDIEIARNRYNQITGG